MIDDTKNYCEPATRTFRGEGAAAEYEGDGRHSVSGNNNKDAPLASVAPEEEE